MINILTAMYKESIQIIIIAIPSTLMFSLIGSYQLPPLVGPPPFNSFVIIAILSILSALIFGEEGQEGFFYSPISHFDKGIHLIIVKTLEYASEWTAFTIFVTNKIGVEPFLRFDTEKTVLQRNFLVLTAFFAISIMTLSFLRAVFIFPWSVLTITRISGAYATWHK